MDESNDNRKGNIHDEVTDGDIPNSHAVDFDPLRLEERSSEERLISGENTEARRLPSEGPAARPRSLTFLHGFALVIGLQIGSGIFSAPAAIRSYVSSTGLAMLAWAVGIIIASTGAASFAALDNLVPLNGGIQEYLVFLYGDLFGFLFAWIWILISRPIGLAMVSLIFSEYLFRAILSDRTIPSSVFKLSAILAIVVITLLNCIGTRMGTGIGNLFLCLKIVGLSSIAIVGISVFVFGTGSPQDSVPENPRHYRAVKHMQGSTTSSSEVSDLWVSFGGFVKAVLAAAFATGGWESLSFVAGEIKDSTTTFPKILKAAMSFTAILFLSSTFALYVNVPPEILKATDAPALEFGKRIFGSPGALFYTWVVCTSSLGALNSIVFTTSRLTQAAGERKYLPEFLNVKASSTDGIHQSRLDVLFQRCLIPRRTSSQPQNNDNTPRNAMILNCLLAAVYVLIGSFRRLLLFKGMMEYMVFWITVFGLLIRRTIQNRDTVHQRNICDDTLWSPLVFCFLVGIIVLQSVVTHVLEFTFILLFLAVCSGLYFKGHWRQSVRGARTNPQPISWDGLVNRHLQSNEFRLATIR